MSSRFILRRSSFILPPSAFILPPSSFLLSCCSVLLALATCGQICAADAPTPDVPKVAPASDAAAKAIAGFQVPGGMQVELVAAEPALANGVCFCFDGQGHCYVAETFRQARGVEDNREHMTWVDDDLAARTVEDRLAYYQKHLGEHLAEYSRCDDRIRRLEDTDGDGTFDRSSVYADHFNGVLEGTGAGLLAHRGSLYYTCIPNLWKLDDTQGRGLGDRRTILSSGYGVHVAYRGHDMHGLCLGPDGKMYFSIGDRGFNVPLAGGRRLAYPDRGAVLRCWPDGSDLEVVHEGLRNPQELAFDDCGNLFTADNNCDSIDLARWVYIVEGADSGWRMHYQYLADRGPWNHERLWELAHDTQPAWLLPPLAHIADGPAGLAYDPGLGLAEKYRKHFFLVDFRGSPAESGVHSFALQPKGAAFDLVEREKFFWGVLATDCDFAPDGSFHVLDWAESWEGRGKGRIYRLRDPAADNQRARAESRRLLATELGGLAQAELIEMLPHADRRVRLAAQLALADRGTAAIPALAGVATASDSLPARLHAILGPRHHRPAHRRRTCAGRARGPAAGRRCGRRSPGSGGQSARRRPGGRGGRPALPAFGRRQPACAFAGRAGPGPDRRPARRRSGPGDAARQCRPRRVFAARRRDGAGQLRRRRAAGGIGRRPGARGAAGGDRGLAAPGGSRSCAIPGGRRSPAGAGGGARDLRRADRGGRIATGGTPRHAKSHRAGCLAGAGGQFPPGRPAAGCGGGRICCPARRARPPASGSAGHAVRLGETRQSRSRERRLATACSARCSNRCGGRAAARRSTAGRAGRCPAVRDSAGRSVGPGRGRTGPGPHRGRSGIFGPEPGRGAGSLGRTARRRTGRGRRAGGRR